jgi:peptidoglycan lytic transglycosylase G
MIQKYGRTGTGFRTFKRIFALLVLLALLSTAGMSYYAYHPLSLPATPFEFDLKQGGSLKSTARQMRQDGLLGQEWPFVLLARFMGRQMQLKAGNYELKHPVTPLQLLEIISKGEFSQRRIGIIEGWTFKQFRGALNSNRYLAHDSIGLTDVEILQRIGAVEDHPEGLFFPDTYNFVAGSSDLAILRIAYHTMQQRLQEAWASRDANLPLQTPYQALILASIVEKETGTASDRSMIAGVFVNRIRKRMLLQTDPTVIYGMGDRFDGNLRKRDLLADTPYNTYTRKGLTPTPIALPGLAALQATLHPAQTDALYFVARGDGSSHFSNSLKAHNRAVDQYQK